MQLNYYTELKNLLTTLETLNSNFTFLQVGSWTDMRAMLSVTCGSDQLGWGISNSVILELGIRATANDLDILAPSYLKPKFILKTSVYVRGKKQR